MRPAALLTGLTGIVAVMVLVYVGLTAMNMEPHITFGDPDRVLASADTGEAAKSSTPAAASASTVPATASVPATPAALPADKPATQVVPPASATVDTPVVAQALVPPLPPVATPPSAVTADLPKEAPEASPAPVVVSQVAPSAPVAQTAPSSEEANLKASSATTPPTPAAIPQADAPTGTLPASAEAGASQSKTTPSDETSVKPVEEAAKSEANDSVSPPAPSLPLPPTIPTPLARPKPPAETEAKAPTMPEKPAEPAPPVKVEAPVEEASLPPTEAEAARKPADVQVSTFEPGVDLKPVDLSRPLAERAGVLTVGNRIVQLAGIMPTDPGRSCTGPNGKEWPCGTLARTALRAFLLGRTVTCDVPDPQWKGPVTAECRFARVSLSDWLARNGWAEPVAGSPLVAAAEEARRDGRGIYGNDPRKEHKSTLAPTPPPEDPLNPI